jgi:hypothetical protein
MCTDDTNDFASNGASEPADDTTQPVAESQTKPGWNRRTFLKAAALGTAAAAFLHKSGDGGGLGGLSVGPLTALANDLSDYPCTAGDIDVGEGIVINEPCAAADCTGSFCALVKFVVSNITSTGRYCISLHLPATTIDGRTIPEQDVLLKTSFQAGTTGCAATDASGCPILTGTSTAAGKSGGESEHLTTMYGVIKGFPCSAAKVCFGKEVPANFTGKCTAAGIAPCATIGFATSPGNANCTTPDQSPPRGQCRHRQVCVTGFGVTLACADGDCAATTATTCNVLCGQPLRLKATASGGTTSCAGDPCTTAPTMKLNGPGIPAAGVSPDANGCFTINNPQSGTYTVTATDCHGCTRTASKTVTVSQLTTPTLSKVSGPSCTGVTVFGVSPCPPESGVTYSFEKVNCNDGTVIGPLSGTYDPATCQFTTTLPLGQTTCVQVRASNGTSTCDKTDREDVSVNAAVTPTLALTNDTGCSVVLTFTAGASGGSGSYTFSFKLDNETPVAGGGANGNQFTYNPRVVNGALDTACHSLTVTATDTSTNKCAATSGPVTFTQCIDTTSPCPPAP